MLETHSKALSDQFFKFYQLDDEIAVLKDITERSQEESRATANKILNTLREEISKGKEEAKETA